MKDKFEYTPDADVPVHKEGAIGLLCRPFQSHETGLPEWLKNASDEYIRRGAPSESRNVVVLFTNAKSGGGASIACLDCCGMTSEVIERHFRHWADPEASQRGSHASLIQGGHGNGGKCYMTQMFSNYSVLWTVTNGKSNRYGVSEGSVNFGYVPDPKRGRDIPVADVVEELTSALKSIACPVSALPSGVVSAIRASGGFTLVIGAGPKGLKGQVPVTHLVETLQDHPQMVQPLFLCNVFVITNGKRLGNGDALTLPPIAPIPGAEAPRVITIPDSLTDPDSHVKCPTRGDGSSPAGKLVLNTSEKSMRGKKKARHSIVFRSPGFAGYTPIPELDIQSIYRDRIYGECYLDTLDSFKQNERKGLAESPLTRAVHHFISQQIQKYAEEFDNKDKRSYNRQEKDAVSKMNEMLDQWKNRFLHDLIQGMGGPDGPNPDPPVPLPVGVPARLDLSLGDSQLGRGVAIRPRLRFYDRSGARIRPAPFRWVSSDNNVAMVDEDLGIINSFAYGQAVIHAETIDGRLRSNRAPIEVVRLTNIRIEPQQVEVAVGGRARLTAVCTLSDDTEASDVMLVWTESDSGVARVSSSGFVFGSSVGTTEVVAGDDGVTSASAATITVVEGNGRGPGPDGRGRGYPRVLVSGNVDVDPDTNEHVNFSTEEPPVWQRPEDADRNIWWINSAAPLARLFLDVAKGYGFDSREWRMYHVERFIDVIVQVALKYGDGNQNTTTAIDEWILQWGAKVAEVQIAAAAELADFITTGASLQA